MSLTNKLTFGKQANRTIDSTAEHLQQPKVENQTINQHFQHHVIDQHSFDKGGSLSKTQPIASFSSSDR